MTPPVLLLVKLVGVETQEICTQLILEAVDKILAGLDPAEGLVTVPVHHSERKVKVIAHRVGHGVDGEAALLDGERGMGKKALIEPVKSFARAFLLFAFLYKNACKARELIRNGATASTVAVRNTVLRSAMLTGSTMTDIISSSLNALRA